MVIPSPIGSDRTSPRSGENKPIWEPSRSDLTESRLALFARWAGQRHATDFSDYLDLWRWSVSHTEDFWQAIWTYFAVQSPTQHASVLSGLNMPDVEWFPGAQVSYVRHLFSKRAENAVAVIDVQEPPKPDEPFRSRHVTWGELRDRVATIANALKQQGIGRGDRVVGYVPNSADAVIAFLATASLGAVWSACGQDYSPKAAADRLAQLEPVALVAADGYRYAGKAHDKIDSVHELRQLMPSLRATFVFDRIGTVDGTDRTGLLEWPATRPAGNLVFEQVSFNHPLWVLYSSGTTGKPKGIVHSVGGVLLEHLKAVAFSFELDEGDTFFWYTSPSWMVWNHLISALLHGTAIVCYDGSPTYPSAATLWALAAEHKVDVLGTSPAYLRASAAAGLEPSRDHDLSGLRQVASSGSPLPAQTYYWIADHVGPRIRINSASGGTEVVSAFAGGTATVPVWPGELSGPSLGVALDAWDKDGHPVRGRVGELVVTKPMPSMPVFLWNDPDRSLYRQTYFETYPGTWHHGDWITITDRHSVIVHGRSDSTLNRNGIRLGTADIYQVVESLAEIAEALVVGVERPDGDYWMPLFLVLAAGHTLDGKLKDRVLEAIRREVSPRHVPDEVIAVPAIPHTRTGKKLEVPIKRLLQGGQAEEVADTQSIDNRDAWGWFVDFCETRTTARS